MFRNYLPSVSRMASMQSPPEMLLRSAVRSVQPLSTSHGSKTYRAAVLHELNKPLLIENLPRQEELSSDEVRVAVHHSAINFADMLATQGKYQDSFPLPYTPGSEFSGRVLEIGSNVSNFSIGDHVFGTIGIGSFAEEVIAHPNMIAKAPSSVDTKLTASSLVSYCTAYMAFTRGVTLKEGDTVLVTAAAGSTGLAAVDLAANVFKCKVIAACGSDEKCQVTKNKGAFEAINYNKESLKECVQEITDGSGVNVVFDCVGGKLFRECVSSLAFEGTLLPIGFASGDIPSIGVNLILVKNIKLVGIFWGSYSQRHPEAFKESINSVCQLLFQGKIKPTIGKIFPLEQINEAIQFIKDRKSYGKILIDTRSH